MTWHPSIDEDTSLQALGVRQTSVLRFAETCLTGRVRRHRE